MDFTSQTRAKARGQISYVIINAGEIFLIISPANYFSMIVKSIKTRIIFPPQDDLLSAISESIKTIPEKSIIVVTSKVISIWQGRCIRLEKYLDKDLLVMQEADAYLSRQATPGAWCMHTLKNNIFIPSAGIDESNGNNHYILWPKHPKQTAKKLYQWLSKKYHVKNIGVIISDSHTIPLRRGVLGISLAHYGFVPLKDYRQTKDLFGRKFTMSQTNIADGLAAAAVMIMGEGAECTPLAIVQDVPWIKFVSKPALPNKPFSSFEIKSKEDLYFPLISSVPWQKGRGGMGLKKP